jgi:malonate decarboxylase gamma subunit
VTPAEILTSLFPAGHHVEAEGGLLFGWGSLQDGTRAEVIGITGRLAPGVDEAIRLAGHVLDALERGGTGPILVLLDSDSQRMSKRDELLGLNEFLAHLAKCLIHADLSGRHTVGILYGHTAAGAFIATALATRSLVALPGAEPAVMDLPSMARVTKLPIEVLQEKAKATPVFAPGLANIAEMGAVAATWDETASLADQLAALLGGERGSGDARDRLGQERLGRPKAAEIAARVHDLALKPA